MQELLEKAHMTASELSRRANVDYKTTKKAIDGQTIMRNKALDLLEVLNQRLGTQYRPEDISGLKIRMY